jgi:Flp pilus assembly protein CpaB
MRRSPRALLAWAVAVAVALGTSRVVAGDLATLHRRAHDLGAPRPAVVALRDLALGATVRAGDVRAVRRYAGTIPAGVPRRPGEVVGRVVVVPVLRDGFVPSRALAPASRSGLDAVVPSGRRAVHVMIKDGFRPPRGAVVDVLAAFDPNAVTIDNGGATAATVAQAAQVVSVDDGIESGGQQGTGVTLLVTEDEARAVAFAATNAELSLALAPPETACCSSIP